MKVSAGRVLEARVLLDLAPRLADKRRDARGEGLSARADGAFLARSPGTLEQPSASYDEPWRRGGSECLADNEPEAALR